MRTSESSESADMIYPPGRTANPLEENGNPATSAGERWIIVEGRVIDVEKLIKVHPGGHAVLLANLGRDASADFHHVGAHARPAVKERLRELTIGHCGPRPQSAWVSVADYLVLIRNAFDVQEFDERPSKLQLAYIAQFLAHLVDDHLPAFRRSFCELAGRVQIDSAVDGIDVPALASAAFANAGDGSIAIGRIALLRESARRLLCTLVGLARAGIAVGASGARSRQLADESLATMDEWIAALPRLTALSGEGAKP